MSTLEEQLKKLKPEMQKDELAGFEFNARMKRNVMKRFGEKESGPRRYNRLFPAGLSAAFLVIFSVGIYWLVESYYTDNQGDTPPVAETPPVKEEAPVAEAPDDENPELIIPPYVPEG